MEKIRKLFITLLSSLILLCNFSFVFAEEDVIDDNNENEPLSENPLGSSRNDDEIVIVDNTVELNNINNKLNNIYNSLTLLNSSITTGSKCYNFNNFSNTQLIDYYNNYYDYKWYYVRANSYNINMFGDNYYYDNDVYYQHIYKYEQIFENGNKYYSNVDFDFYLYQGNTETAFCKFYNLETNSFDYELKPFKLNIINYGLGEINNSVNIEPYISSNIYYDNQSITLTYDNSNDDFNGWFINGQKISDSLSYTFNITTDTNIYLNYYEEDIDSQKSIQLLTLVFIMLLFIMFRQFIWGV